MRNLIGLPCLVALLSLPSLAGTVTTLYANNAVEGTPYVYQIDATTGAVLNTYTNLQGFNGRGVVDVNNIMYYTTSGDRNVYKYDLATQTPKGVAFNVAGASGLASITYDGTNFWIGNYPNSGTNHAFEYSPTGTLLKTITLSLCTDFCDGLTFFKQGGVGYLLSNRVDGCCYGTPVQYDVYDTNGNLITANLFSNNLLSTGVAWDGSNFWTSDIGNGSITEWSMTGVKMGTNPLTGYPSGFTPLVEGMSFNSAQTVGTPEPGTFVMLGTGLLGLAGFARRKMRM